ncbi:MAG: sigma 54-interacting transcriptional regulator [Terriglobales bacterium]
MQQLRAQLAKVAATGVPVLLEGESGSGKELAARYLHHLAPAAAGPFLKLSCPALSRRAAPWFGAVAGSVYLHHLTELDAALQAQLLQWLQEPPTARAPRLIAATQGDLAATVAAGRFRRDLFYRINVVTLRVPPLRERRADLPALVAQLLARCNQAHGRSAPAPPARVWRAWEAYDWPGNLRELENLLQRYVILEDAELLISGLNAPGAAGVSLDGSLSLKQLTRRAERQLERELITQALVASHWNRKRAAGLLRISYRALLYKIKASGLPPPLTPAGADLRPQGGS